MKQASVPSGFDAPIKTAFQDIDEALAVLQVRRTLIERERERRELRGDIRRIEIEIDEYKERLESPNTKGINKRKIESHIVLLGDRVEFAKAMLNQVEMEIHAFKLQLDALNKVTG